MKTSMKTVEKKARTLIEKALENGYCLAKAGVATPDGRCCLLGMVMAGGNKVSEYQDMYDYGMRDYSGDYRDVAGDLLGLSFDEAAALEAGFEGWEYVSIRGGGDRAHVMGTDLWNLGVQLRQDYMVTEALGEFLNG